MDRRADQSRSRAANTPATLVAVLFLSQRDRASLDPPGRSAPLYASLPLVCAEGGECGWTPVSESPTLEAPWKGARIPSQIRPDSILRGIEPEIVASEIELEVGLAIAGRASPALAHKDVVVKLAVVEQ